jgi:hypothetical protein
MNGLKTLFQESYIEVPESKVDLVDNLAEQNEKLEERVNELTELAINLNEENEVLIKERLIAEAAEDLADTQAEKLYKLVEDFEFTDEESFLRKVNTVKESHFKKGTSAKSNISEESGDDTPDSIMEASDEMAAFVKTLRRTGRK